MLYNVTHIANSTGIVQFTQRVSDQLLGGWLGIMILIIIFSITLLSFLAGNNGPSKSFIGASYITAIMSLFMRILGLITDTIVLWVVIAVAVFVLLAFALRRE